MKPALKQDARGLRQRISRSVKQDPIQPWADPIWFSLIFGIAFLLRLAYLFQIHSIPLFYNLPGDPRAYNEWAQRIAAGDWLGTGVFYQAPLYPYFLAVLQILFGHDLWLIRLAQIVLGALSCAVIFLAGQLWIARAAGLAAGLFLAGYAPAIFYDSVIDKSVLDLLLVSVLLALTGMANRKPLPWLWLAAGALVGLLGLSRENALILAAMVPAWIAIRFGNDPALGRLRWMLLFCAGLLFILVPVGLRNLSMGGEFKLTTSQLGANFFIGNNPVADGTYDSVRKLIGEVQLEGKDAKRLAERGMGRTLNAGEVSDYWLRESFDYIGEHTVDWLALLGKKWLMVWNDREVEDSDDFYIYLNWSSLLYGLSWIGRFGILAPLAAAGIWITRAQWRRLWFLYVMILALAASVAVFYIFGRYRYPLVPVLALFSGAALADTWRRYQACDWKGYLGPASAFIITALLVNWPIYDHRGPGAAGYNNLSNAFYRQGHVDQAIQTALKAIALEPEHGVTQYNLGNLYAGRGRYEQARRHFQEALRIHPNYADAHSNYGQVLAEQGDLEAGMRYFRKAIELDPLLSRAHLNLGVALAKTGRIDEAVAPLKEAARLVSDSADARFSLASVYAAQDRYDDAVYWFNETLRIQPNHAPAHQALAELFMMQGKRDEAQRHYQNAQRILRSSTGPVSGP
jgi:Tfp pilus assembly protein PilF/4-amino-4-deoxy-L-arabinose transferase-like glycosyltransferase